MLVLHFMVDNDNWLGFGLRLSIAEAGVGLTGWVVVFLKSLRWGSCGEINRRVTQFDTTPTFYVT